MLAFARRRRIGVSYITLDALSIRPCRHCDRCLKTGDCIIDDDMAFVSGEIDRADMIIIASPVYFGSISAQLKIMIDRAQPYWVRKYRLGLMPAQNKRGVFILLGARDTKGYFPCSKKIVDIFFKVLGITCVDSFAVFPVDAKGAVLKLEPALKRAERAVSRLIQNER